MAAFVRIALAVVLLVAALAKAHRLHASATALATHGIAEQLRLPVTFALVATELALGLAVAVGSVVAAYAAATVLALFAAAIGIAIVRGRSGAPCGCFGARSRIGASALVRNLMLAAGFAVVPSLPTRAPTTAGWLALGLTASFIFIAALTIAVLALAREVGVLRLRIATEPALDIADEDRRSARA